MGLIKEAAEDFDMLIDAKQKEPWVYFNLATCLISLGKPLDPAPENYKVKNTLSSRRRTVSKTGMQKYFEDVLGDTHFLQSHASSHQGTINFVRAVEMCEQAIKFAGNDQQIVLDSLNLKGVCLYRLGHLLEAMKTL